MNYEILRQELFQVLKTAYYQKSAISYGEFFQGELKVLNFLDTCENCKATPSLLCQKLFMTSARIAVALKSAENKGFIKRQPCATDKRSVYISITTSGKMYVRERRLILNNKIDYILKQIGNEDAVEFVRIVKKISNISINKISENGVE